MISHIKVAGFVAALLVTLLPPLTLAQDINFSVAPAEVRIKDLPPGGTAEFKLTVTNNDAVTRVFTLTTFQPPREERREGRARFRDDSWISFCPSEITLAPGSQGNVTVTLAIPEDQKWAARDWEIWLAVAAQSSDLLHVKLYSRLLVSTTGTRFNIGLVAAIAVAVVLLGYGGYRYFRRKARRE